MPRENDIGSVYFVLGTVFLFGHEIKSQIELGDLYRLFKLAKMVGGDELTLD
jgi:hypothetical protein